MIGRSFHHSVLKLISDSATSLDRELSTLQRAELILEAGRIPELEYVFRHDLTREAAYNSILIRARREFHKRVGEAVEELFSDRLEDQAHRLAHHFYEAQDQPQAFKYSMMAGDAAAHLYAHREAESHYSRAMELANGGAASREQCIEVYISRGRTLELLGEFDQALANYQQLHSAAQEQDDRGMELAALIPQATVHFTSNPKFDPERGRELSVEGLSLARELNDYRAESRVLWNLMLLEYYEGRNREQAISYGEQSLEIARQHGLQEQLAYTLNDIARAYFTVGKVEQAWAAQKESSDLLRQMGNLTMLTDSLITSAGGHYFLGSFDDAMTSLEECVDVTKSTGSAWGQAVGLYVLGAVYIESGEIGKCVQALEEALPLAKQAGFSPPVTARLRLALYYGMLGNIDRGFQLANEALEEGDNRQFTHAALAQLHLCQGNISEADTAIKEACRELENGEADPKAGYAIFQVIEGDIAVANQQYGQAIVSIDRTLSVLQEMGQKVFLPDILRCKGEALFGLGRNDEARTILQEALTLAEEQNSRRALWAILVASSRLASHSGDEAEANSLRTRALDVIQYMAEHAGSEESKTAFLDSPKVSAITGSA